jgi:hypothetical protein|tara:strand:- start:669 stop:893 length:225 start_codon:yes stop_codon:yes gene_type:complete
MKGEEHDKIRMETHDAVQTIRAVLLGANGDNGLVGDVKRLANSHYKLKQQFWVLVGLLVGSGILAGGISVLLSS